MVYVIVYVDKKGFSCFCFLKALISDRICYDIGRKMEGSLLTDSFMTIAEQRHIVPKLAKRVFMVFVKNLFRSVRSV